MPPRVTLQAIADRAGVTRALVSMALRNSPKVATDTRRRLQALAQELGYVPNPMVQALMTSLRVNQNPAYQSTLAFITNMRDREYWRSLHTYPDYFTGAIERARELGYHVEHFWMGDYAKHPARLAQVLKARGIQGILIPPLPQRAERKIGIDLSDFSVVTFGYSLISPNPPRVSNHHLQTVEKAALYLTELGYRKIGFAVHESDLRQVNMLWSAGFHVVARKMPELQILEFRPEEWTEKAFLNWFFEHRPEVIVGVTMEMWSWTQNLGLVIPEEVGFLHLDCRRGDIFSGMCQNTRRLGAVAVEMLAGLVQGNIHCEEKEPTILMINSDVHVGKTLRARPR
jgi:DNA-binding LacI/PurR family transcriptional regulator